MADSSNHYSFLHRFSIRRNQVISVEQEQDTEDLDLFQKHVADRFSDLIHPAGENYSDDPFLSVAWLRKLLDLFLSCEAEFKSTILAGRETTKPDPDRFVIEFLDRTVKSLDVCNAVMHGLETVRHCQKLAEIAVAALDRRPVGDGQVRRAKKALSAMLLILGMNNKETESKSFGRRFGSAGEVKDRNYSFRSLTYHVSSTWSAARQLHAMSNNLAPPRGAESTGPAKTVYIMSSIMYFVMWTLVSAIPCQDRVGLPTGSPIPSHLDWSQSIILIQDKIGDEWRKKEKRGTAGLMDEMQKMERLGNSLLDFADTFQFPAEEKRVAEVAVHVSELSETCRRLEEGLLPLQQQIREVFHRLVRSRMEILDAVDQVTKLSLATT